MAKERLIIEINEKGARVVSRKIATIGTASAASGTQVNALKTALVGLGGALVLRSAISTLASFSQEMSTTKAITQATDAQFKELSATARDLGANTRFSATQAAEGMTFLARAGFSTDQVLTSIEGTLNLAQAGALGLGEAADITSNILQGFRLPADQAARAVDVLAFAANNSNTNVSQLGQAMKFVAPIAAGVGVSMEEATASISALSDAGLQASMAGTGLRKILSELESPSTKTAKILDALGLSTEDVRVSQVGLTEAMQRLAKAGVDTGLGLEIFGDRGGPAFEVLSTSLPKVQEMTTALNEQEGTARRIAEVMDDNLNGALLSVRSALEAVILSFGEAGGAAGGLTSIVRGLASALRFLADNVEILQGLLIGVAITQLPLLIKGITILGAVIVANPLGAFIIALSTVIGLLAAFKDDIKLTEDGLVTLGDVATIVFDDIKFVVSVLVDEWKSFLGILDTDTATATESTKSSFRSVLDTVATVMDTAVGIVRGSIGSLQKFFGLIPFALKAMFVDILNEIIDLLNAMVRHFLLAINNIRAKLQEASRSLPGFVVNFDQIIAPQIKKVTEKTRVTFREMGQEQARAWRQGFEETPAADFVASVMARATEKVQINTEAVANLNTTLDETSEATEGVAEKTEKSAGAFDVFAGVIQAAGGSLKSLAAGLGGAFINSIDTASGALADFAASGFRNVKDLRKAFSELFADLGKEILKLVIKFAILKAVQTGLSALGGGGGAAGGIAGSLAGAAGNAAGGPVFGGAPTIVGERGPELFVPPRSGTIVSNEQLGRGQPAAPPTIINVTDPEEISAAMSSTEGEEIILNVIGKNPNAIRQMIGQ